ncbi:pyrimidine/purine nucleoside phosphorylase [Geopsychrobacter electrodiphilus]|uniref:pyrimidine/purine nucleoside phosphorylase n=1 Tax=Geopsychrobacter electrodiphilus TaxID=225196 RepID=UPI000376A909|nr:pyrimidine/purine nucleoside phosphorylase [Geopsychrobacter electrodiphilus]
MKKFKQVNVIKKANIYFNGKVTSRTLVFDDSSIKTLGIMLPGEYLFNTDSKEVMEILSGDLEVLLPDDDNWITVTSGGSFEVPAQSKFELKVKTITDYCCSFVV